MSVLESPTLSPSPLPGSGPSNSRTCTGSFVEDRAFRDIDIAVMLSEDAQSDATGAALDIGDRLARIVEYRVDVRALNQAPLTFQFKAARGRLLACRDEGRLADFIEHLLPRYFDLAPRLLRATREAFGP